jgi:hypothetical protein
MAHEDDYASKLFKREKKDKKHIEHTILIDFLSRLQLKQDKIVKSEKPDFKLEFGQCSIGCEITQYYADREKNSHSRKFLAEWEKYFGPELMKALKNRNEQYKHVYGAIHFKKGQLNKIIKNREVLINELVDIVACYYDDLNPKKHLTVLKIKKHNFNNIIKFVEHIFLENISPKHDYFWWPSHLQSGIIPNPQKPIENIISGKVKLSSDYEKNFDQKWLIIFAEGLLVEDICILEHFKLNPNEINYFTHIYVFNKFPTESITQLYPEYGKVFSASERKIYIKYLPL